MITSDKTKRVKNMQVAPPTLLLYPPNQNCKHLFTWKIHQIINKLSLKNVAKTLVQKLKHLKNNFLTSLVVRKIILLIY
jgi:hypothetical protein